MFVKIWDAWTHGTPLGYAYGSIEPLGFHGVISGVRRRSSETWLKAYLHHSSFYFLLYWAKMGFDKSLENCVRVRRVCKC